MKICHVCNIHPVDDGRVFSRSCVSLAEAGYEVHLFAVGKKSEQYQEKGVFIHPLDVTSDRTERFFRRKYVAQRAVDLDPDVIHVHEPELLGSVLKYAGSIPVIYDVHESYIDMLREAHWIPKPLRPLISKLWEIWEQRLVRRCSGIVVVTEPIAKRYKKLHKNVKVIHNYPDITDLENLPPVRRDGRTCVYAGALNPNRGLEQVFKAIQILKIKGMNVPFKFAGPAISENYLNSLIELTEKLDIHDLVEYQGVLSKADTMKFQIQGSIGLVPYMPVPNNVMGMPNKLVECMAMGIPVVFSRFPIYMEVAGNSGAGIAVNPCEPFEIADAIEKIVCDPQLAKQMGEAGRLAARTCYSWGPERQKLFDLYDYFEDPSMKKEMLLSCMS